MTAVQLSIQSGIPIKEVTERCFQLKIDVRKQISPEDTERIKSYAPKEQKFETLTSKINPLENIPGYVPEQPRQSGCKGYKYWTDCGWEYDCDYNTILTCEECKYGGGNKNPEAKKNQI